MPSAGEVAAEWMRAPSVEEEVRRHPGADDLLRLAVVRDERARPALIAATLSNAVARSSRSGIFPGAIGKLITLRARMSVSISARRVGFLGQRPQQHRVDHAEDRGARADAKGDRENRGHRERRILAQRTRGEARSLRSWWVL